MTTTYAFKNNLKNIIMKLSKNGQHNFNLSHFFIFWIVVGLGVVGCFSDFILTLCISFGCVVCVSFVLYRFAHNTNYILFSYLNSFKSHYEYYVHWIYANAINWRVVRICTAMVGIAYFWYNIFQKWREHERKYNFCCESIVFGLLYIKCYCMATSNDKIFL